MKIKNMEINIRYKVIKGNDTFYVGDQIRKTDDGDIICTQASGWIDKDDIEEAGAGVEIEVDKDYYIGIRKKYVDSLNNINNLIENH